jgi:dipeptidyl aminopeptidase/acylaminoacyl peptidase
MSISGRTLLTNSLVLVTLAVLPSVSGATFVPGPNGKIAFASGSGGANGDDTNARIWVADYPSGIPVPVTTAPLFTPAARPAQHRHPNWSPDHTKIVYAAGEAFTGRYALWIKDLVAETETEFVPEATNQDRPSWSPDGTRIAYGSGGKIFVKDVAPGSVAELITNGTTDERPVWSPDGGTLYFNRGAAGNRDIFKKSPVTLAGAETSVLSDMTDDWQPALSPDGRRLCFLRGPQSSGADLFTVNVDGTGVTPFSVTPLVGDLNCVWSPDGSRILYTLGAFEAGELDTKNINGGDEQLLTSMNVPAHFDGNADWATNFSPRCDAKTADVAKNGFVSIPLSCVDPDHGPAGLGPAPLPLESDALAIALQPFKGNLGAISNGRVIYTPAKDFTGTDTFTYTGSDEVSNAAPATVTVRVAAGGGDGGPDADRSAPVVSSIALSRKRWRLGRSLPHISKAAPVGTTISFRLSEAAQTTVSFQRASAGRRVGGSCVKPTRRNRSKARCTRFVGAGAIAPLIAKRGANRVAFQGRLNRSRRLATGTYRVLVSARDAAGNRSAARVGPTFTIVPR